MRIHIIQNVLLLTLINRLSIAICLKFQQSKILSITPKTKSHNEKKAPSPPLPHGAKMAPKKRNKAPQRKKNLYMKKRPLHKREKGAPQIDCFLGGSGGGQATTLVTPLCAPMSKCDNEMHNIFDNYSPLIYIKIHFRIHPIELFCKKISQKCIPSNP